MAAIVSKHPLASYPQMGQPDGPQGWTPALLRGSGNNQVVVRVIHLEWLIRQDQGTMTVILKYVVIGSVPFARESR